jgi:predicted nucleic acid-binding protein
MAGNIHDLSAGASLPPDFVLDTNILFEVLRPSQSVQNNRALSVFHTLQSNSTMVGFVSPISVQELFHVHLRNSLKATLKQNWSQFQPGISREFPHITSVTQANWTHLLKAYPAQVRGLSGDFAKIVKSLRALNLYIIQPQELSWTSSSPPYEDELRDYMTRFGCDSADAAILLDASQIGVRHIVTLDRDFRNAKSHFEVYTWL